MLEFLLNLEANNNRDWFHAHRDAYRQAKTDFESMVSGLIARISTFDKSVAGLCAEKLTFKLNRDTRFSRDPSPYNPAFRAHIGAAGKQPVPVGYYLMLCPGNRSFLGGGLFADGFKDATAMVRQYIAAHGGEWDAVLSAPEFRECFEVRGTSLKKVPAGVDAKDSHVEFLKKKSWYVEYPVDDQAVEREEFLDQAAQIFRRMQPFNALLNRALSEFRMPVR